MVNQKILDFLAQGEKQGFPIEELKKALLKKGFNKKEVEEAINTYKPPAKPASGPQAVQRSPPETEKIKFFTKLKLAITKPNQLFEKTESESLAPALKYQLLLAIFPFVITSLISIFLLQLLFQFLGAFVMQYIPGITPGAVTTAGFAASIPFIIMALVTFFIAIPIFTFILAGITQLVAKMFKGQGNFTATYKATVYSSTPGLLLIFIPLLNFALGIWSFILNIFGISSYHKISKGKAAGIIILSSILISMLFFILMFISTMLFGTTTVTNNPSNMGNLRDLPTTENPELLSFKFHDFTDCFNGEIRVFAENTGQYLIEKDDWTIHEIDGETVELDTIAELDPAGDGLYFGTIMSSDKNYTEGVHKARLGVSETNIKTTEITC
jgi:hypothetical protein